MRTKLFIPEIAFDPELGKRQEIRVLLNEKNELPLSSDIDDILKNLDVNVEIGNEFYKDNETQYLFANIADGGINKFLSATEWRFTLFNGLSLENCADYEAIKKAILELGYVI